MEHSSLNVHTVNYTTIYSAWLSPDCTHSVQRSRIFHPAHWPELNIRSDSGRLYYRITSISTGAALTYYQGNNTVGLASYTGDGAQKWKLNLFGLEGFAANSLAGGNEKAGTIGGVLGETVFVSTADELEKQLNSVGPQTIVITADIDMQKKSHTRIRDNKTIIGSYSKNTIYDSQFRTNDTYGAVDDSPSDNIVFRNLNMIAKNVSNRILINIWSSRQIWVDHCTFISYLNSDHTGNGYDEVGKFIWLNTPYKDSNMQVQ